MPLDQQIHRVGYDLAKSAQPIVSASFRRWRSLAQPINHRLDRLLRRQVPLAF
jgi:hypothetical protein